MWAVCKCLKEKLPIKTSLNLLLKDIYKTSISLSFNDLSDVIFSFGRVIGSLINKPYYRLLGDRLAVEKFQDRMLFYGCVSKNYKCKKDEQNEIFTFSMEGKMDKRRT